jgi:hypothetical protein
VKVSLTLWQRMNLEGIIRQKRTGDGEDFLTMYETWKKITVPDSERKEYFQNPCATCGTARGMDMQRIKLSDDLEVDLEKAEARKITALIQEWKNFSVDDGEWLIPLKLILKEVSGSVADAPSKPAEERRPARRN